MVETPLFPIEYLRATSSASECRRRVTTHLLTKVCTPHVARKPPPIFLWPPDLHKVRLELLLTEGVAERINVCELQAPR